MSQTFRGGMHPPDFKSSTRHKEIEDYLNPDRVVLPVTMHIGAPCKVRVEIEDTVDVGQVVASTKAPVSAPVHASVSGRVTAIEPALHPNGTKVLSVIVENDFENRLHSSVAPMNFDDMSNEERLAAIRAGGIVGHGGAAFPTELKIRSAIGKVDTILINGAECEPYITSDHRLMLENPEEIIGGIKMLKQILGVDQAFLGVETNKKDTFERLEQLMSRERDMRLSRLKSKYPQGAEKQLILAIKGREVPSGKLPADVGCAVFNVDTVAAVYRLFSTGMPDITRVVTCAGDAMATPKNLRVPIGTQAERLVDQCDGFAKSPNKLLFGGPMMGQALFSLDVPVLKGTNAFLAITNKRSLLVKNPICIRCGKCVSMCPVRLLPSLLYKYGQVDDYDMCKELGALDCIECGACSYECPGRLPLVQQHRVNKRLIMIQNKK